ncbi:AraC family transcriptional regulator [Terriglobus roseus]|uniref:AraC family transcriptional regulator n=1 Tax=Terriglobus roseus TaxID=392734 RepID=A0A1G7MCH7_9BACT|nr:AraC family transcriptional regulator [Terriglobus roseus]SDF59472.1 AraC family transcriptional regulator [Terriglobus roseus]
MEGSITVRQGSATIPIVPNVVRRHAHLATRGVHVEHHVVEPTEFPERELLQHNIFLYTGQAAQAEIKSPEFTGLRWIRPGALWIMPEGCRHGVRFEGKVEGIALAFDPSYFDDLVESHGGKRNLPIMQSLTDCPPKIEHLMRALLLESTESTEEGMGLECIATAIALSICDYAGATRTPTKTGPKLTPRQMRAVQTYVEDHLHKQIALADLAIVAKLSVFHFLRSFKESLGTTPARYVLDRRLEKAKTLLANSPLSVTEIGLNVGFEDVSHFSRAFRREVGMTPSLFRGGAQQ